MYACIFVCVYLYLSQLACVHMHCVHMVTSKFVNAGEECACSCVNGTGAVLT